MVRPGVEELGPYLQDGFTRYLTVDILHGTDVVESDVRVESWSLPGDLGRDPKTTGRLRIVHSSVRGESWVPRGSSGLLSPFRATLQLTEVVSVGGFERRVQLGLFDVVEVPFAQDVKGTINARWVESTVEEGLAPGEELPPAEDLIPFSDSVYLSGRLEGGQEVVLASIVDVDVESLDGRVLGASFRSPRMSGTSAWGEWRAVGLLPVIQSGDDATIPAVPWPAEAGSRLNAVQSCARSLGGVPVVDSFGQWVLAGDDTDVVELFLGEQGTVVELSTGLTLDGFANVIVGNYEAEDGTEVRAEWVASGVLAPDVMGREIVRFRTSNKVRTTAEAEADVAEQGWLATSPEFDVAITCVYNPLVELGDRVTVAGEVSGVVQRLDVSDSPTMVVTARARRVL